MTAYAELDVTSNFTLLTGASKPEELAQRAAELAYRALGIADKNTLAGVVGTHVTAVEAHRERPRVVGAALSAADRRQAARAEE